LGFWILDFGLTTKARRPGFLQEATEETEGHAEKILAAKNAKKRKEMMRNQPPPYVGSYKLEWKRVI
jgi:hypothetical protein